MIKAAPLVTVSQLALEVMAQQATPPVTVSQVAIEVLVSAAAAVLARVQGTGKISGDNVSVLNLTFAAPPVVGNGIVVEIISWTARDYTLCGVTDNRGHTYQFAQQARGGPAVAVFFCPMIAATGTPFTVTFTSPTIDDYIASATEVGGLGGGSLAVDQAANKTGTSTGPNAGPTAALAASNVCVVAVCGTTTSQASITVQSVVPAWVEECESLSTALVAGEADMRVLTGVAGMTTSVAWTLASSGQWAAVLVAFKRAP